MVSSNEIFSKVSKEIKAFTKEKYNTDCYVVGERVYAPSMFPCVWVVEMDALSERNAETLDFVDVQRRSNYEVQIYSNLTKGATLQTKAIADEMWTLFKSLGFRCITSQPIDNGADETIKRHVMRFTRFIADGDEI